MSAWIFPTTVDKNKPYHYEVDRAFDTLNTLFWGQSRLKSIDVGDTVYIYASPPVQTIYWRCTVLDVNVAPQNVDIDDSEFEHGYSPDVAYVKLTATRKFNATERFKLSYAEMCKHGLKSKMQSPFRPQGELLEYINSIESSVIYDD